MLINIVPYLFVLVFNSNFAEGSSLAIDDANQTPKSNSRDIRKSPPQLTLLDEFEDSDNEFDSDSSQPEAMQVDDTVVSSNPALKGVVDAPILLSSDLQLDWDKVENDGTLSSDSHTSSPLIQLVPLNSNNKKPESVSNMSKMSIVVKDAAYTTYKAMLYYVGSTPSKSQEQTNQRLYSFTQIILSLPRCPRLLLGQPAMAIPTHLWTVCLQRLRKAPRCLVVNACPIKRLCPVVQSGLKIG